MEYETVKIEIKDNIAVLSLNRPKAMNALNSKVFEEIDDVVKTVEDNTDVKVLIITGEGKAFVAGADIAEMADMSSEAGSSFSQTGQSTFKSFENLEIPVIAAINGYALGGGLELAMGCDFRIANTFAKFGQPEVGLGLIPGYAGTARLPRLVGLGNALYLLMTADVISADEALRMGLVQKVVEPENLIDEAIKIAKRIASKGPLAIKKVKYVTRNAMNTDFKNACTVESQEFGSLFGKGSEGELGMKAFLNKEKPDWK
ncbi:MAG: enoyl-CoA hydratase-related protein [Bacteroidota bacterium]|nr:enoyl-CoA hydratase-related protein [Bacteroidota bacterium]